MPIRLCFNAFKSVLIGVGFESSLPIGAQVDLNGESLHKVNVRRAVIPPVVATQVFSQVGKGIKPAPH